MSSSCSNLHRSKLLTTNCSTVSVNHDHLIYCYEVQLASGVVRMLIIISYKDVPKITFLTL